MTQNISKRKAVKPPPRDVVYQLAHEEALKLMRFDRKQSQLGKQSIMAWSASQTTAGLRCIEAWCYGDFGNLGNLNDPTDRPHRKRAHVSGTKLRFDHLGASKMIALRMIYMMVCVSEMQRGRSLDTTYDIILPGMNQDWYTDLVDLAVSIVNECNDNLAASVDMWLANMRQATIDKELKAFKARRRATRAKRQASEATDTDREQIADVIPLFSSKIS
ncbi:MAG: hypothetical protein QG549_755 [Patescibacteria group bacterium]|nr:hypothetical protein [Patescibacteria group bacterium]